MIAHTLKFVVEDVDRHGNVRVYLRRKGVRKVRLFEMPGTSAFLDEYQRALQQPGKALPSRPAPILGEPGSFRRLCQAYFAAPEYLGLGHEPIKVISESRLG